MNQVLLALNEVCKRERDQLRRFRHRQRPCALGSVQPLRRMGYLDWETAAILTEIGLLEINHRVLDAGGPFPATLELLVERFPRHAEFIRAFDVRWVESL